MSANNYYYSGQDDIYQDQDLYQPTKKSLITAYKSKYQGIKASLFQSQNYKQQQQQPSEQITKNFYQNLKDEYQTEISNLNKSNSQFIYIQPDSTTNCCSKLSFLFVIKMIFLLLLFLFLNMIWGQYQISFKRAVQQNEHLKRLCSQNQQKYKCNLNYYPEMESECNQWKKCSQIDSELVINKLQVLMEILKVVPSILSEYFDWGSNGFLILMIILGLVFVKVLGALKQL